MLEIKEKDFNSFFNAPFNAYGEHSPYVSPLKSDFKRILSNQNPLFKDQNTFTYFSAIKDGIPVGRVVTHVHNDSNKKYDWKRAYFGFFDCINDLDIAKHLFDKVENWASDNNYTEVIGNFNLTAMQQIGVMMSGFNNKPYTDQVFSPNHIADLLHKLGYVNEFPMTTFELDLRSIDPQIVLGEKQNRIINEGKIQLKKFKKNRFNTLIEDVRDCLNDGFANNPMFVPLTKEEFLYQSKDMTTIIDENISVLAYDESGPIGVILCIPDLNPFIRANKSRLSVTTPFHFVKFKLKRDRAVIIFYSVKQKYQNKGLNGVMLYEVLQALKIRGYKSLGITWISDQNKASLRQAEKLGCKQLHNLSLFKKNL